MYWWWIIGLNKKSQSGNRFQLQLPLLFLGPDCQNLRLRENPEEIELGLDEYEEEKDQTVGGMLKTPLGKT